MDIRLAITPLLVLNAFSAVKAEDYEPTRWWVHSELPARRAAVICALEAGDVISIHEPAEDPMCWVGNACTVNVVRSDTCYVGRYTVARNDLRKALEIDYMLRVDFGLDWHTSSDPANQCTAVGP